MNAPIRTPKILTDAQYEAMARKGAFVGLGRVELRGGVVVDMGPPFLPHSNAMSALLVEATRDGARVRSQCLPMSPSALAAAFSQRPTL